MGKIGWALPLYFYIAAFDALALPPPEVLRHSPILVSRRDQTSSPYNDRFLFLGYSTIPSKNGNTRIRYTAYFTDEDSVKTKSGTESLISRYGRRLDIEWIYEVLLSPTGAALERKYHCDLLVGIGHKSCAFKGNFEEGSDHPILFNIAKHNVFSDRPSFPQGSSGGILTHLEPTQEIPFPMSRDLLAIMNPDYMRISDEELRVEGRLEAPSTEYAYLRIRGKLTGNMRIRLKGEALSPGVGNLRDMGLDLWGKESVVAIRLSPEEKNALINGTHPFRFEISGKNKKNHLELEEIGLFLIGIRGPNTYIPLDLSSRIRCSEPKNITSCSF